MSSLFLEEPSEVVASVRPSEVAFLKAELVRLQEELGLQKREATSERAELLDKLAHLESSIVQQLRIDAGNRAARSTLLSYATKLFYFISFYLSPPLAIYVSQRAQCLSMRVVS